MIIGLTGKAGVGKDTVADILVADYGFSKISFATPLKTMLASIGWPEPPRELKETPMQGFNFSWRHAAQTLGTEWGRNCLDPDIWLKLTMQQVLRGGNWVISDCRFPNEAEAIRKVGTLVHVYGRDTTVVGDAASHASEAGLPIDIRDYKLRNDSNLSMLGERLLHLMEAHFEY